MRMPCTNSDRPLLLWALANLSHSPACCRTRPRCPCTAAAPPVSLQDVKAYGSYCQVSNGGQRVPSRQPRGSRCSTCTCPAANSAPGSRLKRHKYHSTWLLPMQYFIDRLDGRCCCVNSFLDSTAAGQGQRVSQHALRTPPYPVPGLPEALGPPAPFCFATPAALLLRPRAEGACRDAAARPPLPPLPLRAPLRVGLVHSSSAPSSSSSSLTPGISAVGWAGEVPGEGAIGVQVQVSVPGAGGSGVRQLLGLWHQRRADTAATARQWATRIQPSTGPSSPGCGWTGHCGGSGALRR